MSSTRTGGLAGDRHQGTGWSAGKLALGLVAGLVGALSCVPALAAWELNMPRGVTPISREAYDMHMLMLYWCVGIGIVVFGVMFYSMWRHRRAAGAQAAHFHHSTLAEIAWTVIPVLILVSMAIPATQALIKMEDMTESDMTIKVTGYQWKWRYDYIEDDISFYSNLAHSSRELMYGDPSGNENYLLEVDNPVVVPIGKKIRFLLTSDDVIHAWWVPALGQKKDAIPGFINQIWARAETAGVYRGQCAELCGRDHGYMPIVVIAVPEDEYRQWVAEQQQATEEAAQEELREWARDELMARGQEVYMTHCSACHQPNGQGLPPQFPPIAGGPIATGPIESHLELVLKGKPGTTMQAFGPQLSSTDIAAVVTYQRNALNSVGDMIQPGAVQDARN